MFDKVTAFSVLFLLASIELGDGAMVAHNSRPYLAGLTFAVVELGGGLHGGVCFGLCCLGDGLLFVLRLLFRKDFLIAARAEGMLSG